MPDTFSSPRAPLKKLSTRFKPAKSATIVATSAATRSAAPASGDRKKSAIDAPAANTLRKSGQSPTTVPLTRAHSPGIPCIFAI